MVLVMVEPRGKGGGDLEELTYSLVALLMLLLPVHQTLLHRRGKPGLFAVA